MEMTKTRMDADIRRTLSAKGFEIHPNRLVTIRLDEIELVFLRGLKAAERICVQSRQGRVCPLPVIRAAIRRLEEK